MDESFVQVLANVLSSLTIVSCLFLKVPQIMNIRQKQSAEGIYIQAMLMEIIGFTIVTLYNFMNRYSLMTYLEYPIILLQIYIMLYYVLKYKRQLDKSAVIIFLIAYASVIFAFFTELIPKATLSYMVPFTSPLSGFSKVTYIYGIIKANNADAVSLATWCISIGTNLSRLFTVYVDSADMKLMGNFFISVLLSCSVLLTALYYKSKNSMSYGTNNRSSSSKRQRHDCKLDHDD